MASLLRKIVAGPRTRHPEAGLDLCYVTSQIIATSGPSGTYPQLAYRNPLDQLVKFLDYKHGEDWAIWEFRAEGTGYPDLEVYGRVWHYPWPDHHPPPFRLVPMIMASMRNWLRGEGKGSGEEEESGKGEEKKKKKEEGRVVVVHCKAGKGRSGTVATSYLISECGWNPSEALARFTERRMRPGFGQGVSIPSQLRWVGYVDRWTKGKKVYVERQIEIMEVHVWGLRDGVKVQVEGFVDEGKTIKLFHIFTKKERVVVDGVVRGGSGITEMISNMAGWQNDGKIQESKSMDRLDGTSNSKPKKPKITTRSSSIESTGDEEGGGAVIFKPSTRVILPSSDINIDLERRNKASMGWTMVTAVAHVWFNAYFEGNGPEQAGRPDDNGVFEIEWDKMDGIKGSSRKGTRALDRLAVVWKAYDPKPGRGRKDDVILEPGTGSPVPQMAAADWKGNNETSPGKGKDLGLRTESPISASVSKASSMKSSRADDTDDDSLEGVKTSSPSGGEVLSEGSPAERTPIEDEEDMDAKLKALNVNKLTQPQADAPVPDLKDINAGLDTASATTAQQNTGGTDRVEGISTIPTSELPGGIPEDEMKTAKDHKLGHLQSIKKTIDS